MGHVCVVGRVSWKEKRGVQCVVLPFPRSFNAIGNMTRGRGMIPTPNRIKAYELVIIHLSHPKFSFMEVRETINVN